MLFATAVGTSGWQRTARAALLGGALLGACVAHADELVDLRAENARLKAEVQALSARLDALHGRAQSDGTATGDAAGSRVEPVYVPRSRVSLKVATDSATGESNVATLWYRTADSGMLPRKEWIQLGARQSRSGELEDTWLLLERRGGGGGAKVPAGRLTVDGRDIELPVTDYDAKRKNQSIGPISSSTSSERIRFALPASALPLVAQARAVHFAAGAIEFDLTDEHLAAFAALASRLQTAPAASSPGPKP